MLGRLKLYNTLLACDQGNINQITARSWNGTLVTVVNGEKPAPLIHLSPIQ